MLVGVAYLKREYKMIQILSVVMVTLGIFLAAYASTPDAKKDTNLELVSSDQAVTDFGVWCVGIAMLVFALVMSAFMGAMQENTYNELQINKSEVPWQENLFYTHLLSIPVFLFTAPDILNHIHIFNTCKPMWTPLLGDLPSPWFYLGLNVVTQYICIRGVYMLVAETDALTCTLLLNIRKLMSLVLSIYVFQHPFTLLHTIGVALVVLGSFFYVREQLQPKPKMEMDHAVAAHNKAGPGQLLAGAPPVGAGYRGTGEQLRRRAARA